MVTGLVLVCGYEGTTKPHDGNMMCGGGWFGCVFVCWRVVSRPAKKPFFERKRLGVGKDDARWGRGNLVWGMAECVPMSSKTGGQRWYRWDGRWS